MPSLNVFLFSLFFLIFNVQCAPQTQKQLAPKLVGDRVKIGDGFYPRATRIHDKSLLGCFTAVKGKNKTIEVVKSTDDGKSWDPVGTVVNVLEATHGLDTCAIHQMPNSTRILVAYRNNDRDPQTHHYTSHIMLVSASDDKGKTWEHLSVVAKNNLTGARGVWEPFMKDALDGSLMLFFSLETRADGKDQDSILVRSKDGGKTWYAKKFLTKHHILKESLGAETFCSFVSRLLTGYQLLQTQNQQNVVLI